MSEMDSSSDSEPLAGARVADPARLRECVHCGLCLNACPTYLELGTEMDSPRGRIYLIKGLAEGRVALDDAVVRHLDLCLGCRACEPACPSGVRYGTIIEEARAYIERTAPRSRWQRLRRAAILTVFPHRRRIRAALAVAQVARGLGLWSLATRLADAAALLPPLRSAARLQTFYPAAGRERARVGLLRGCVSDALFSDVNAAAIRVLTRHGVAVVVPPDQVCCGALHLHSGAPDAARRMARDNVFAFPADLDAVLVTAAGCGSAMKEYGHLLAGDAAAVPAQQLASRVRDVTEFLAELNLPPPARALALRATYHDACHLAHAQGVRAAPRQLLAAIPGLALVELGESDVCCGSAGSYNLTEPAMARRLRERKIDHIAATGAQCVAVANPGCALQIRAGLAARGLNIRVAHPVELLDEAYTPMEGGGFVNELDSTGVREKGRSSGG
jgi:glycolate oxidase iron-sulfur subunit